MTLYWAAVAIVGVLLVAVGAPSWAALGAGLAYLAVTAGFAVPHWTWIWLHSRHQWR